MNQIYFLILLILPAFSLSENTAIISSSTIASTYYETFGTFAYHFSSVLNGVDELEILKIENDCSVENYDEKISGKIVIVDDLNGCWNTKKIEFAIDAGASAVGVIENHPGWRYNYYVPGYRNVGGFPVFSVGEDDVDRWTVQGENRTVLITLEEIENPYQVLYESAVFAVIQVFFLGFFSVWAVYVIWKLVLSVQYMGVVSILSICLAIELFGTCCRIAWWVDPIGSRCLYTVLASRTLFGLASDVPIFIIQVLLALYWMESLHGVTMIRLLSPVSIAIVASFGIAFIGLDVFAAWSTLIGIEIESITGGIITIFVLAITIFYFVMVYKLLKYQKKINSLRKKKKNCSSLALYITSGILCIIYLITAIFISLLSKSPLGYIAWYTIMSLIVWAISSSKIIPINPRGNSLSVSKVATTVATKRLSMDELTGSSSTEETNISMKESENSEVDKDISEDESSN